MIKKLFLLAAVVAAASFAIGQDITGDWQGPLTTPFGELRMVLHITKATDGTLKATLDSPDQGSMGAPLDTFTLEGSKVHFALNVAKGVFDGSLKGNGTINGYWVQGAAATKMPLTLSKTTTPLKLEHNPAPPSDIDGTWEGTYNTPPSGDTAKPNTMHVTFHIKNTADGLTATADLPEEMNIKGWPATSVMRKGNSLKIGMKQVDGMFSGKLNKTLDSMSGDWTEGDGPSRSLNLKKTAGAPADAPKPDAQKQ
jgi:hypothetical protein